MRASMRVFVARLICGMCFAGVMDWLAPGRPFIERTLALVALMIAVQIMISTDEG